MSGTAWSARAGADGARSSPRSWRCSRPAAPWPSTSRTSRCRSRAGSGGRRPPGRPTARARCRSTGTATPTTSGTPVVATRRASSTSVVNLGNTSYGRYVVVDHGGGWTTLHAHLLACVRDRRAAGRPGPGRSRCSATPAGRPDRTSTTSSGSTRSDRHAVFNGVRLHYNSWVRSRNCGDVPSSATGTATGAATSACSARQPSAGVYRERLPDGTRFVASFGRPTDQPVVGDWNGDGQTDLGVVRPDHGDVHAADAHRVQGARSRSDRPEPCRSRGTGTATAATTSASSGRPPTPSPCASPNGTFSTRVLRHRRQPARRRGLGRRRAVRGRGLRPGHDHLHAGDGRRWDRVGPLRHPHLGAGGRLLERATRSPTSASGIVGRRRSRSGSDRIAPTTITFGRPAD